MNNIKLLCAIMGTGMAVQDCEAMQAAMQDMAKEYKSIHVMCDKRRPSASICDQAKTLARIANSEK